MLFGSQELIVWRANNQLAFSRLIGRVIPLLVLFGGCRPHPPDVLLPSVADLGGNDSHYLDNLLQVTGRVFSGGQPHGEEAFAELQRLGVKTVVSVDGSRPQVATAEKYGLRYVHIPIGYDGVPEEAGKSLARLMRETHEPIYIHCHHGQHRAPAAAAVACIAAGKMDHQQGVAVLRRAGTGEGYTGLWAAVANFQPPASDAVLPELVAVAEVGSLTAAMAHIDRAKDNLALAKEASWSGVEEHPDLVASQEALILREALHEFARHRTNDDDEVFVNLLAETESIAIELESAIKLHDHKAADEHFVRLLKSCKQCHVKYRD